MLGKRKSSVCSVAFQMDDDMSRISKRLHIVEQLKAFIADDERYGRMHADLHDLIEASEWLLQAMNKVRDYPLTADSAEDFLIDLDINYVQHATFHLNSLRADIASVLGQISETDGEESPV